MTLNEAQAGKIYSLLSSEDNHLFLKLSSTHAMKIESGKIMHLSDTYVCSSHLKHLPPGNYGRINVRFLAHYQVKEDYE